MGVLSNGNAYCPICGGQVSGLFTTKIKDGMALCGNCGGKIRMDKHLIKMQSVANMRQHLAYRDQNARIFSTLSFDNQVEVSGMVLRMDTTKQFWYASKKNDTNPTLYRFNEILDFNYEEEYKETQQQTTTGSTKNNHGVVRSIIGGAVAGKTGAYVGAMTGRNRSKSTVNVVSHNLATVMAVTIRTGNPYESVIRLNVLPAGRTIEVGTRGYNKYRTQVDQLLSMLEQMKRTADQRALPVTQMAVQNVQAVNAGKAAAPNNSNVLGAQFMNSIELNAQAKKQTRQIEADPMQRAQVQPASAPAQNMQVHSAGTPAQNMQVHSAGTPAQNVQADSVADGQEQEKEIVYLSGADEILKYKKLMDAGIITEEEFNFKKRQILGM